MSTSSAQVWGLAVALAAATSAANGSAQSFGRWHMPSTPGQFFGYCYGPGHHAPMVRTPGYPVQPAPRTVVVPSTKAPYCPAPYRPIAGCGEGGCSYGYAASGMVTGLALPEQVVGPMTSGPELAPGAPSLAPPVGDQQRPATEQSSPTPRSAIEVVPTPRATVPATPPMPQTDPLPSPEDRAAWRWPA